MHKIFLTIVVLFSGMSVGYCQEPNQPFQLTIKSDKSVIQIWEPVLFEVELLNHSSRILANTGWYRIEPVDSEGKPVNNIPDFETESPSMWGNQFSSFLLKQGEKALAKINVGNSRVPGVYHYKAVAYIPEHYKTIGLLSSKMLTVKIAEKNPHRLALGEKGQFVLYVANEYLGGGSSIDIKVYLDDEIVTDKNYKSTMKYNEAFTFNLNQGRHSIRVESQKGRASLEQEFDVDIANSWASVTLQGPGKVYFRIQDEPMGFE